MRFLIIDDSITMRRIIANILMRLGYPEAVHAANGREALDRLGSETIDAVITDWYMPEMNGLDFVKSLRSAPSTSHLPIIIVTANAASDDIQHALRLGVSSYILKPFTVDTMREKIAAVASVVASNAAAAAPRASAGTRAAAMEAEAVKADPVDAAPAPPLPTSGVSASVSAAGLTEDDDDPEPADPMEEAAA